jgi:hypothetical protein
MTEATELAAVVELDFLRQAQLLPSVRQEIHDHVHLAAANELNVDGLVEDILADQEVVAGRVPFQVTRPHDIYLVHLVGVPCLRSWIFVAGYAGR